MPYARRDDEGHIVSLHDAPTDGASEAVGIGDPAVQAFLLGSEPSEQPENFLAASDAELLRVVEDLVNLMIRKNLIMFTELPDAVQRKLKNRERARENLRGKSALVVDQDDIL